MLNVHVWAPQGDMVGHASLSFGTNYVSFWPADAAGKKDLKIKTSHPGAFVGALQEDIHNEGGRQPVTVSIPISKDNEDKLAKFVADLVSNTPRYQLAKYNCSTLVAECLKVACGKEPSFEPTPQEYGTLAKLLGHGTWTPNQLLRYAKELATECR